MEDVKHIEQLFFKQIKNLTAKAVANSYDCLEQGPNFKNSSSVFDYQFSDGWIQR